MSTNSTSIRASTCKGVNCASTDGANHSAECEAEHAAACAGGDFVPWSEEFKRSGTAGYGLWFSKEQRDESIKNELRRLRAANVELVSASTNARDMLAVDRQSFVDCQRLRDSRTEDPIAHGLVYVDEDTWLDEEDAEVLREYDRAIELIDAAVAKHGSTS